MGETTEIGLAELLSVLSRRKHSGRLNINSEGEEIQIFIEEGKIILVSSSSHSLRLGRVLVRLGILESARLDAAVRAQDQQGGKRPLGRILVDAGWVSSEDLARAAEEQCVEALTRMIVAEQGTFMFTRDAKPLTKQGLVALNTDGIVLEASRRADELFTLRSLLPGPDVRLSISRRAAVTVADSLSALEQRIMSELTASSPTLAELQEQLLLEEVTVWRTVISLRERGLIAAVSPGATQRPIEPESVFPERTIEQIVELGTTQEANPPNRVPLLAEVRAGVAASSQTIAAITVVVREVIAAFNAGLNLRAFASFSDDHFRRQGRISDEDIQAFRAPGHPLRAEEQETFLAIRDVRLLQDGRVSAILHTHVPRVGECRKVMIFTKAEDRWLIDAVIEAPSTGAATMTTMLPPAQGSSLLSTQAVQAR